MSATKAKSIAIALNEALDSVPHQKLKNLHEKHFVNFTYNKEGHEELDQTNVKEWYKGALPIIDQMIEDENKRFGYGNLGSVWMDLDNVVVNGKSKKVRFYLAGVGNNGYTYDLGMDATFEAVW